MDGKNLKMMYEKSFNEDYEINNVNEIYSVEQWEHLHNKNIK
jgi:hypothetical protein